MRSISLLLAIMALAVAAPAIAGKGGNDNGAGSGGSSESSSKPSQYAPTLGVSWPLAAATEDSTSTPYVIEGCGYDSSLGMVTVVVYTPVSAAWTGRMPDNNGCISVSNFSTQGSGRYRADAWQHVRNRDIVVATTIFDA